MIKEQLWNSISSHFPFPPPTPFFPSTTNTTTTKKRKRKIDRQFSILDHPIMHSHLVCCTIVWVQWASGNNLSSTYILPQPPLSLQMQTHRWTALQSWRLNSNSILWLARHYQLVDPFSWRSDYGFLGTREECWACGKRTKKQKIEHTVWKANFDI